MTNKRQIHALNVYFNEDNNIVISQSSMESRDHLLTPSSMESRNAFVIISKDQADQLSEWILEMANEPDMEGED